MNASKWADRDLRRMESLGMDPAEVSRQLEIFRHPPPFIRLDRPATVGEGILQLDKTQQDSAVREYEKARGLGRLLKFVPASGAATRMFLGLQKLLDQGKVNPGQLEENRNDKDSEQALKLMAHLPRTAFYGHLEQTLRAGGRELETLLRRGEWGTIWEALLSETGLHYSRKPKALIPFHAHGSEGRTPLEEHLIEGIQYVRDDQGICRIHFTVSEGQETEFKDLLEKVRPVYEKKYGVQLRVGLSAQNNKLDTLAVDLENNPFRDSQGDLVFRPAGHGALLENLNALEADLVLIKNIDNVSVGRFGEITVDWKKRLAGFLAGLQAELFGHLRKLGSTGVSERDLGTAEDFTRGRLGLKGIPSRGSLEDRRLHLLEILHRPIRVCGMVANQGEPGGGPFWVRGKDGAVSLQIVEASQVDPGDQRQQEIFRSSSHFNPVDLVCGLRDGEGRPFDLDSFADPDAVFISRKSFEGRDLKALERPGLWNGAMSRWITLFVEVPSETFNPVKTVFDLLKPSHRT